MDYLATFENTSAVLQAEQVLMRRKIPFEIVPNVQYQKKSCGLGILFSAQYLESCRRAFETTELKSAFFQVNPSDPL